MAATAWEIQIIASPGNAAEWSPAYLGQLFSKNPEIPCVDYLTKVRACSHKLSVRILEQIFDTEDGKIPPKGHVQTPMWTHPRINEFLKLLRETSLTVQQISGPVGTTNINYLYTTFKKPMA